MEDNLRAFVKDLFAATDWPDGGGLDYGDFQDLAIKHGLLLPEIRFQPCGEICQCAEFYDEEEWKKGVTCYRMVPWLLEGSQDGALELRRATDGGLIPLHDIGTGDKDGEYCSCTNNFDPHIICYSCGKPFLFPRPNTTDKQGG